VVPIGVRNGDTGVVPDDAVRLGVANAGEAMTTNAEANTSATNAVLLRAFIVFKHPSAK
jgi:hypothetical protein